MLRTPQNMYENEFGSGPRDSLLSIHGSGSLSNYNSMSLQDFGDISSNRLDEQDVNYEILTKGFTGHNQSYKQFAKLLCDRLSYLGAPIEEAIKTSGTGLVLGVMAQLNPRTAARIMYISLYTDVGLQLLGLFLGCYAKYRPQSKSAWSRMIKLCLDLTREFLQGIAHAEIVFLFMTEIFGDIVGIVDNFEESDNAFPALPYYFILGVFATLGITCASLLRLDYWHRTMPEFVRNELKPIVSDYAPNLDRFVRSFMKSKTRRVMTALARWFTISNLMHAMASVSIRVGYALSNKPEPLKFDFISEASFFGAASIGSLGIVALYESNRFRSFINYWLRLSPIYIFIGVMGLMTKRVQEQGEYDLKLFYLLEAGIVALMLTAPSLLFLMHTCLRSCLSSRGYQWNTDIQIGDDERRLYEPWYDGGDENEGDYENDRESTVSSMRYMDADAERLEQELEGKEQKTKPVAAIEIETQTSSAISDHSKDSKNNYCKNSHRRVHSWTPGMFTGVNNVLESGGNMQALGNVPNVSKDDSSVRYRV